MFNAQMIKRLRRFLGKRYKNRTRICVSFELATPADYHDPDKDEVLILDMLDNIQLHLMDFHDIPGFRYTSVTINQREIL